MLPINGKTNQSLEVKKGFEGKKQKRTEVSMLDAMFPPEIPSTPYSENDESAEASDFPSKSSKEMEMSGQQRYSTWVSFVQPSTSKVPSSGGHPKKYHGDKDGLKNYESESDCEAKFHKFIEISGRRKLRKGFASESCRHSQRQELACEEPENDRMKTFYSRQVNGFRKKTPVVFGKYGEISSGSFAAEVQNPPKIVSLSKVLQTAKKCRVFANDIFRRSSKRKWKRLSSGTSHGHSGLTTKNNNGTPNAIVCDETTVDNISKEDLKTSNNSHPICNAKRDVKAKLGGSIVDRSDVPLKLKGKEVRKRCIYKITAQETRLKKNLAFTEDREHDFCNTNKKFVEEHKSASNVDSDAFCCVCRNSSNDEINYLLECNRCLIRVHQACYGVTTLPKGRWCCRPCRTNVKDIPNGEAKVITVRHEKKVVFFAERDIFPGEEITYDYHFNHEDEGQKIPCYCNSKNCRRYLN